MILYWCFRCFSFSIYIITLNQQSTTNQTLMCTYSSKESRIYNNIPNTVLQNLNPKPIYIIQSPKHWIKHWQQKSNIHQGMTKNSSIKISNRNQHYKHLMKVTAITFTQFIKRKQHRYVNCMCKQNQYPIRLICIVKRG